MTQQQILDALDNLMPEVVSTNNPEATLLKFAKTNNLYPTQLEKLGHAFNQCKTLVGLSKQANRGDSFSILNVPEMITKYSTYKPSDVLTKEEKKVHKQVDKIVKSAGVKVASGGRLPMPDFMDRLVARGAEVIDNDVTEKALVPSNSAFDVLFNKKASADEEVVVVDEDELLSEYEKFEKQKKEEQENEEFINELNSVKAGLDEVIKTKCASVASYLRKKGPQAWADIVEDSVLRFGVKSAAVIDTVENYLEVNHIPYTATSVDETIFTKYAFVEDRHNMFDIISDIQDCLLDRNKVDLMLMDKRAASLETDFAQWNNDIDRLRRWLTVRRANPDSTIYYVTKDPVTGKIDPIANFNAIHNHPGDQDLRDTFKTYIEKTPLVIDNKLINKIYKSESERAAKNKKLIAEGKPILPPQFDPVALASNLTSTQQAYLKDQWDVYEQSKKDYDKSIQQKEQEEQDKKDNEKRDKELLEVHKLLTNDRIKHKNDTPVLLNAFTNGFDFASKSIGLTKDTLRSFKDGAKDTHRFIKDTINKLPDYDYNKKFQIEDTKLSKDFNLHKLILTDPVIAEADPQEVSEIYNTISEISPRFAQNTRLMATALKEALQYGAVPLNMLKDISEFEKNMRSR